MRDLHKKKPKVAPKNRLKKPPRPPINFRAIFKKVARAGGIVLAGALVVVIVYQIHGVVSRATFLRLERIEVSPLSRLTRDEVIDQAGVKPGDEMLGLRLRRIGEMLAKNPWVESVKVRRYFPHTLAIEIAEREPVAVINMGFLYYLDKRGDVFKPLTVGDRLDYPVVTGVTEDDLSRDPAGSKAALQGAIELMGMLGKGSVFRLADVSEIHFDKGFGYTLFTAQGGVPVRLGNGSHADKLARLARIYGDLRAQLPSLQYIDLDYNDKIIVKKG